MTRVGPFGRNQIVGAAALLLASFTSASFAPGQAVGERLQRLPEVPYAVVADPPTMTLGPGPFGPTVLLEDSLRSPYQPISAQPEISQSLVLPTSPEGAPDKLPGAKDGVLQAISFTGTWLPAASGEDLGFSDLETSITFGFPFPTARSPLVITPAFGVHYLDGPDAPDLPARVYDASMQFRWIRPVGERWTADVAVTPGYYGDYEIDDSDTLRITGRGFGAYKYSETLTLALGVAYLDRSDVGILPVGGLIWKPTDYWSFELIAPRPKIAWRIPHVAALSGNVLNGGLQTMFPYGKGGYEYRPPSMWRTDYWLYIAGEFGGGVWVIERPTGAADEITVRDYRAILGIERKKPGAINSRLEIGYVFGRTVEFRSGLPDYDPADTLLLRAGASY